jgi:hypothetical protein
MKQKATAGGIVMTVMAATALACTWAPLTDAGRGVRVAQASEVTQCQKVGRATAATRDTIANFARNDRKIREELESLARNEGAELGGDAVVPIGAAKDGRQSFDVYRCGTP